MLHNEPKITGILRAALLSRKKTIETTSSSRQHVCDKPSKAQNTPVRFCSLAESAHVGFPVGDGAGVGSCFDAWHRDACSTQSFKSNVRDVNVTVVIQLKTCFHAYVFRICFQNVFDKIENFAEMRR